VGGIWKSLEKQVRKSLECCKQSLMGEAGENWDDQDADRNADSEDYA
jgi:hypothetical protein